MHRTPNDKTLWRMHFAQPASGLLAGQQAKHHVNIQYPYGRLSHTVLQSRQCLVAISRTEWMRLVMALQEWSPLLGQAGSRGKASQEGRRVPALKDFCLGSMAVPVTLALITRVVRLLHNFMETLIGNKAAFQTRAQLSNSGSPASGQRLPFFLLHCWLCMHVCCDLPTVRWQCLCSNQTPCAPEHSFMPFVTTGELHRSRFQPDFAKAFAFTSLAS